MNFKRSYYARGGTRVKKRKLDCVQNADEGDDIHTGIAAVKCYMHAYFIVVNREWFFVPIGVQGAAKKWTPKVFRCYLSSHLEFLYEILQIYLLKPFTSNCQVKCDSVEKRRSYRLFNMTTYQFFSIQKCSGYTTPI